MRKFTINKDITDFITNNLTPYYADIWIDNFGNRTKKLLNKISLQPKMINTLFDIADLCNTNIYCRLGGILYHLKSKDDVSNFSEIIEKEMKKHFIKNDTTKKDFAATLNVSIEVIRRIKGKRIPALQNLIKIIREIGGDFYVEIKKQ